MDLKRNKEDEVNPRKVLSTKYFASGSCGVSSTGSVRNDFNKHEQSVSDSYLPVGGGLHIFPTIPVIW